MHWNLWKLSQYPNFSVSNLVISFILIADKEVMALTIRDIVVIEVTFFTSCSGNGIVSPSLVRSLTYLSIFWNFSLISWLWSKRKHFNQHFIVINDLCCFLNVSLYLGSRHFYRGHISMCLQAITKYPLILVKYLRIWPFGKATHFLA